LRVPAVLMMGNHDRRGPFRAVFQEADERQWICASGPALRSRDHPHTRYARRER
jgi:3',5'-cyclic AMP phosphodiesterase CpdA